MLIVPLYPIIKHVSEIPAQPYSFISPEPSEMSIMPGLPSNMMVHQSLISLGSFLWGPRRLCIAINISPFSFLVEYIMAVT